MPQTPRPTCTVALLGAVALGTLALGTLATPRAAAQQAGRVFRVGVIHPRGPSSRVTDGLREGLKQLGLDEGKHVVLDIRDAKGDLTAVEVAARALGHEKIDLIFTGSTSVTLAVKRATARVPIVFRVGTDPVVVGLVESFAKPGGRLTGVYSQSTDLTAKRLQLLKEILPKLRLVVTFYNPKNRAAQEAVKEAREAARQLRVEVIERRVASVEELQAGVRALRRGEADAYLFLSDAMVTSQAKLVIDTANAKGQRVLYSAQPRRQGKETLGGAPPGDGAWTLGRRVGQEVLWNVPYRMPLPGPVRSACRQDHPDDILDEPEATT